MNRMQLSTIRGITCPESWGESWKPGKVREGRAAWRNKPHSLVIRVLCPSQVISSKYPQPQILLKEWRTERGTKQMCRQRCISVLKQAKLNTFNISSPRNAKVLTHVWSCGCDPPAGRLSWRWEWIIPSPHTRATRPKPSLGVYAEMSSSLWEVITQSDKCGACQNNVIWLNCSASVWLAGSGFLGPSPPHL